MRLKQASAFIAFVNIFLTLLTTASVFFTLQLSYKHRDVAFAMANWATLANSLGELAQAPHRAARDFIATADPRHEAEFAVARTRVDQEWAGALAGIKDDAPEKKELAALDDARAHLNRTLAIEERALAATRDGRRSEADAMLHNAGYTEQVVAITRQIGEANRLAQERLNLRNTALRARINVAVATAAVVIAMQLIVTLLTLFAFYQQKVVKPVVSLTAKAQSLARGDRNVEFDFIDDVSELGELSRALQAFSFNMYQLDSQRLIQQRSESWYRRIVDFFPDALFVVDASGNILRANTKAHQIFGYDRGELVDKSIDLLTPPDIRDSHAAMRDRFMQRGESVGLGQMSGDFRGYDKDGREFPIEIALRIVPTLDDRAACVLVAVRDISQRQQFARSLADQLAFQRVLIDTIPYPVFFKGLDGRYLGYNQAFIDYFGIEADALIGKTVLDFELLPLQDRTIYHEANAHILRKGGTFVSEMRIPDAHGELHRTVYRLCGFHDRDGKPAGLVGILVDLKAQNTALHAVDGTVVSYADLQAEGPTAVQHDEIHVQEMVEDIRIISALETCIRSGIATKTELVDQVASDTGESLQRVQDVLEKYTGNDPARHLWAYQIGAHGAHIFELIENPTHAPIGDTNIGAPKT